jgi:hypothetical protein
MRLEWLAEAFYEHLCQIATKEQRGLIIHELLSADGTSPQLQSVAIRLAMIHAADDVPFRLRPTTQTNRRLN